ncbi:hypothetical protein H0I55_16445 [Yersinia kristensenii]|uniref:hypothetical protein n=1 Tax=Yersinia kristensenii TaxID=28152 RepID=UPI001C609DE1|nr:hypothetical protein [Yersinia kristensenii]MBW5813643.1 hypothetical protein [Yersinia kristensenii]
MMTFLSWHVPLRARAVAGVIHFEYYGVVVSLSRGVLGHWQRFVTGVKKPAHGGHIGRDRLANHRGIFTA